MIFPDIVESVEQSPAGELPMLKEYAYDLETGELLTKNGGHYLVEGNEALKIWIYKAITTKRYKYIAYSADFGTEVYSLIGTTLSTEAKKAEARRYIVEALMVNPYIVAIEKVLMKQEGSVLHANIFVKSIYENKVVNVSCLIEIA